ncbi:hypothetical protein B6N58_09520 [Legionella micdadei]|uniref:DUF1328 domain-containing protein n=1 Tax=Legionella micdadei TaxID=451 RepID=A0A1G5AR15_LEGMI|nr:hypothetical protein B6N58_09520 [Legionella micdadei]ARG99803.1 hypothetical protein B6V88_04890 [Legionella micdadei]KTD28597.1 hypothetical protein Lmic_1708 [Legionella micdadei]SCX80317.1 hypothetical protein SAMN02982997_00090 [Legionella micdadei]
MLGWLVRVLFVIAGSITSLFVSRDALNFSIFQMVIAVLLFTILVIIIAFWPMFTHWYKQRIRRKK